MKRRHVSVILATGTFPLMLGCESSGELVDAGINASQLQKLKKSKYSTYVTFLSVSSPYVPTPRSTRVATLKTGFRSFASGIGNDAIAIWVAPPLSDKDAALAKDLHDLFELRYSDGPYVILSSSSPLAVNAKNDPRILLDFTGVNPDRIDSILATLEQQIRTSQVNAISLQITLKSQVVVSQLENIPVFAREFVLDLAKMRVKK